MTQSDLLDSASETARIVAESHIRQPDMAGADCQCPACSPGDFAVTREEVEAFFRGEGIAR